MSDNQVILRFALMLNNQYLKRWQLNVVEKLCESGIAKPELLIIFDNYQSDVEIKKRKLPLLWRLYNKLVLSKGALENVFLTSNISKLPILKCKVYCPDKYSQYFFESDLEIIRSYELDFILRFGFSIIRGDILNVARYGIWSYHHSDEQKIRGGPMGFWEIFNNHSLQGVMLQKLTNHLDGGVILKKRYYRIINHCFRLHVNTILIDSVDMPLQVCYDILNNKAKYFENDSVASTAPVYTFPSNLTFCKFLAKLFWNRLKFYYKNLFKFEKWQIIICKANFENILQTKFINQVVKIIDHPKKFKYYADPFIVDQENNSVQLIFEYFDYRSKKGNLGTAKVNLSSTEFKLDLKGQLKVLTNNQNHFSFPSIFRQNGKVYVLPEQINLERVDLYQWDPICSDIKYLFTLLEFPLVDPVLFFYNDYYWIFGSPCGYHANDKLLAFFSKKIEGPYEAHIQNPLIVDPTRARMAGAVFFYQNKLIRPAQESHLDYGKAIKFQKINQLTPNEYVEEFLFRLIPPSYQADYSGIHTIYFHDQLCVFDVKRFIFSFRLFLRKAFYRNGT